MSPASGVPFGIFTIDPSLIVRTWPDWLARVTGISTTDALNRSLAELVPDLGERGLLPIFERVLSRGTVEVLAPALHRYLIACSPSIPDTTFDVMQQRVTIGPVRQDERIVGAVITIEDVTARVQRERELSEQLAHPDAEARRSAARALAEHGRDSAIAPLTRALADPDLGVRRTAVVALSRYGQEIVDELIATIRAQHGDFNLLSSALDVLATSDIDVIAPLVECLRDDDVNLRIQAALILGARRDRRAVGPLIAALDDPDVNVVFHAIEALGHIGATDAIEPILKIVDRRDFFLGFPAIQTLARIGDATVAPRLVPLLADELLRTPTVEALGQVADEAIVMPLVDLLNRGEAPTEAVTDALTGLYDRYESQYGAGDHVADLARRSMTASGMQHVLDAVQRVSGERLRGLARVLGWLDGPAVRRALTRLLGQPAVRAQVVEALVRYGARVVDLLVEQLNAEDLDSRQAAAVALGRIGDRSATPALIAALHDRELALTAAGALARIAPPDAFDPLLALIGDPDTAVRQAAIAALNSIGDARMPARIRVLLSDPSPLVRESAVKIAGYFGYRDCIEPVLARCHDESEAVRRATVDHLPFFDDPRVPAAMTALLEGDTPKVRAGAAAALGRLDEGAVLPALMRALGDRDPWVRYFALRSLGGSRNAEVAPAVLDRLEHDEAGQVRLAAIEVLGELDAPGLVAVLGPLTSAADADVARAAIRALGRCHDPLAGSILERLARGRDAWRRIEALGAVAARGASGSAALLQWVAAADDSDEVAVAAIDALKRSAASGSGDAAPDAIRALVQLLAEPSRHESVVSALAGLAPRHVPDVAAGLRHPSVDVRRGTVAALGRMKHPDASRALEAALDDAESSVRAAAITELRRLGSRGAVRRLLGMARTDPDAEVRHAAILAVTHSSN